MRTINFRVWTGIKMEYDILAGKLGVFYAPNLDPDDSACICKNNTIYPKECPVMQSTNLKDKNGKEIYEGDIVRSYGSSASRGHKYGDKLFDHVVEFIDGGFAPFNECNCTSSWTINSYEIIGNIYESPELIKEPTP